MFAKFRHAEPAQSTVSQVARAEEVQLDVAPRDDDATSSSATVSATVEDAELQPAGVTQDTLPPHGGDQSVTSAAEEVDAEVSDDDSGVSEEVENARATVGEQVDPDDASPESDTASVTCSDADTAPEDVGLHGLGLGAQPRRRNRARALAKSDGAPRRSPLTGQQRLLLLDTWRRSGLPAGDFADLVGISKHSLYKWKHYFEEFGPAGLQDQPRQSRRGSRLPELTRRTILMVKESHPEWGCQRISDSLLRGPALPASASAVARVLHEAGYEEVEIPTHGHPDKVRRFERARPNQLWQTDLFTFVLKRQNRRVHLVGFLDDHSRFIVSYGLHATASTALVLEAVEAAIASYGPAEEILTDNGPQYVTWRGTSQFTKHLQKRGIKQIVARPRRPQTLGKIERFWGTLWREFLQGAVFVDLTDARARIGHFIDYYNFQRQHRGIGGLVPADRFFGAAQEVLRTLRQRVAANALELARHGQARKPFYVTGQVEGQSFSVHAEGERLILHKENEPRQEITLTGESPVAAQATQPLPVPLCPHAAPPSGDGEPADAPPPSPGTSPLDSLTGKTSDEGESGGER